MSAKIFSFSAKRVATNAIIFVMVVVVVCVGAIGGSLISSAKMYNGVYYSGDENSQNITLMINVYWGTEFLDEMLQILAKYGVTTTFFVGGTWAVQQSDMLQKIVDAGHEIGNHGYYHKNQGSISAEKNYEEILNTHNLVKSLTGVEMNLFAPPSGSYSKKTVEIATSLGYKTIMWTQGKDTIDWRDQDADLIYSRAVEGAKGGDFVLMHPTAATVEALEDVIVALQGEGFNLCTVSENIS